MAIGSNFLDRESELPLLIASDLERGLGSVFSGGTHFPHPMMLGASRDTDLAYSCGEIFAREARAVGINVIFGPCLDLADDTINPIVNIRAFGADPKTVSEMGIALMSGIQANGLAAVGKHFPGHGATAIDSHTSLPRIAKKISQLKKEELQPFKQAAEAGIRGLMPGHLCVGNYQHPATMEARLTRAIIRKQWNYDGVLFTDAMDMAAITNNYGPAEQAFLPIEAGIDVILMPKRVPLVHHLLTERINSDPLFRSLAEAAAERIIRLKRWLSTQQAKQMHPFRVPKNVEHPQHIGLANKVAERGISLIEKSARYPFHWPTTGNVQHLIFTDSPLSGQPLENFCAELQSRFENVVIHNNPAVEDTTADKRKKATLTIVSLYVRTFEGNLQKLDWTRIKAHLTRIQQGGELLAVFLFGNPHRISEFPASIKPDALFLVPSYVAAAQQAAARALCGAIPVNGVVSVPLKKRWATAIHQPATTYCLGENAAPLDWKALNNLINTAISKRYFPGCSVAVAVRGKLLLSRGYGTFDYKTDSRSVETDTIYGLASLTKVMAATPAVMKLIESGELSLAETLGAFYPQLGRKKQAAITIADLLAHQSGYPAWKPFYQSVSSASAMVDAVLATPLAYKTGSKAIYSDLGFILLYDIVEKNKRYQF